MENKKWYQLGDAASRNRLATIIIWLTFIAIITLSVLYYFSDKSPANMEKIFSTLIPLFATWIGTVLAFYFGKENFDIAAKRYDKIIDHLSPDVLDDINVTQIMISSKTMVFKDLEEIKDKNVKEIIDFLNEVKKTRLPVLYDNEIKYVIHKSVFLDALNQNENSTNKELYNFQNFLSDSNYMNMATSFLTFDKTVILEKIRTELAKNSNIKDVFIIDENKKVIGWLTDTLILRYLTRGH